MTTEDREYYAGHVMDRVNQIQLAVIGIGIAMLAINYLGLVTVEAGVLGSSAYWQRIILLLLVILFACYTALVYNAYPIQVGKSDTSPVRGRYPTRIFSLFLLDIFQVTLAACMFGVLFIPDARQLIGGEYCVTSLEGPNCLGLPEYALETIFVLGALWHLTAAVWYWIADGLRVHDVPVHCLFAIVYLGLAAASYLLAWFDPWVGAGGFLLVLSCLFLVQGSRWLRA